MSQIVLFAQQKGGAGKTMLLTQVAVSLAGRGRQVAIIDLDPQRSASEWHELRVNRLGEDAGGISLIESTNWRASADIHKGARKASIVLVDSPGTAEVLKRVALKAANFCVVPCQPSAADVWACRTTLQLIEEAGIQHKVLLNRVPPRSNAADAAVAELAGFGAPVIDATVGTRSAFVEAFMTGAGVTETARKSKAAAEIEAVVKELKKPLGL